MPRNHLKPETLARVKRSVELKRKLEKYFNKDRTTIFRMLQRNDSSFVEYEPLHIIANEFNEDPENLVVSSDLSAYTA